MKVICSDSTMKNYGLTQWKVYDAQLTITNPKNGIPTKWYTVTCDDGQERKFSGIYFLTQEEWRERQINKLL